MVNDSSIFKAMRVARKGGGIVVHADDGTVIDVLVREAVDYGYTSSPSWYGPIDPVRGDGDAARDHGGARANSHVGCLSASDALAHDHSISTNAKRCPHYLFLGISNCGLPRFHEVGRSVITTPLKELRPQSAACRRVTDDQVSRAQELAAPDGFHKIPNGALGLDTCSTGQAQ
jgi:dihydropyrimidinase